MSYGQPRRCEYCGQDHRDTYKGSVDHGRFECANDRPKPVEPTGLDGGPAKPMLDNTGTPIRKRELPVEHGLEDLPRGLGLFGTRS